MNSNNRLQCTSHYVRRPLNRDVGSEYMATARPMDPPQERCEPRRPRGNDFGPKPGTADE